jgi:hypothetical protein
MYDDFKILVAVLVCFSRVCLLSKDVSWDENEQFCDEMEPKSALLARLPLAIHAVEFWSMHALFSRTKLSSVY